MVASEVKTLAAQTGRATEDIRGQIERIQSATSQAVPAVAGIASTVAEMDSISTTIAAAVEEQGAATGARTYRTPVGQSFRQTVSVASRRGPGQLRRQRTGPGPPIGPREIRRRGHRLFRAAEQAEARRARPAHPSHQAAAHAGDRKQNLADFRHQVIAPASRSFVSPDSEAAIPWAVSQPSGNAAFAE